MWARIEILNWQVVDDTDPQRLARTAAASSTLASLVIQAINLGEDNGVNSDLAEAPLAEIARFSAYASERLACLLAGRA